MTEESELEIEKIKEKIREELEKTAILPVTELAQRLGRDIDNDLLLALALSQMVGSGEITEKQIWAIARK